MIKVLQVQMYLLLILINDTDLGPHCLLMSHNKDDRLFTSTYALVSRPVVALSFAEFLKFNIPYDDTAIIEISTLKEFNFCFTCSKNTVKRLKYLV